MEYVYDIVLNFQDKYYEFYEWRKKDKIINIKKIPIYKITNKDYLNIKNNNISIIKNTLPKPNKMFLLTNGKEVIGILIDNIGKILKKSSLIFEEADDILFDVDKIELINIKYNIIKINKLNNFSRIQEEKIKYINKYLNKQKDEYVLKYLYYEIFKVEQDDIKLVYKELLNLQKTNINRLYNGIKKVNLELKKLSF